SGHGKVIIDVLRSTSTAPISVIDDNPKSESILGIPIVKTSNFDKQTLGKTIISIGNNKVRKRIACELDANYVNAIHASVVISSFSKIGKGTVIMAGVKINPDSTIGEHCIVNTG